MRFKSIVAVAPDPSFADHSTDPPPHTHVPPLPYSPLPPSHGRRAKPPGDSFVHVAEGIGMRGGQSRGRRDSHDDVDVTEEQRRVCVIGEPQEHSFWSDDDGPRHRQFHDDSQSDGDLHGAHTHASTRRDESPCSLRRHTHAWKFLLVALWICLGVSPSTTQMCPSCTNRTTTCH